MKQSITRYAGFLLILVSVVGGIVYNLRAKTTTTVETSTSTALIEPLKETSSALSGYGEIYVDIKGEVIAPGVYSMRPGERIFDLIKIAGGVTASADTSHLNLAMMVEDEMVVIIPKIENEFNTEPENPINLIVVEIKGEVRYPGVYEMPSGSRIEDLITKAGELTAFADTSTVSKASVLTDGEAITIARLPVTSFITEKKILVEIRGEVNQPGTYEIKESGLVRDLINLAGGITKTASLEGINLLKPLVAGEMIIVKAFSAAMLDEHLDETVTSGEGLININTADLETLMTLSGIGIVLGQRIIDYRAEYGDFLAIEDVMFVSGIKESVFQKIADAITVG